VAGLIVIVVVVALPLAYMIWRFKTGAEAERGGSFGSQLDRDDEDWGPRS
jgi:hypothetical protein